MIDFAVALRGVAVAHFDQRPGNEDGNVERAADDELLVVEIARMGPRRIAADASECRRRGNAHAAEERTQRDHDAWRELRRHRLAVQREDLLTDSAVAVLGNESGA